MDVRDYLGLEPTDDPLRWRLPIRLAICGGSGFLHGGCGLGATIQALEDSLDKPVAWATAQYLGRVEPGEVVDVHIEPLAVGRRMTQATVRVTHGDRLILWTMASLGGRGELGIDGTWVTMPDAPPPSACPIQTAMSDVEGTFRSGVEARQAYGGTGERRCGVWLHSDIDFGGRSAGPGILGDMLPNAMRVTTGRSMRGASLDNSIRMAATESSDWLLVDSVTDAFGNGIGQGLTRIWTQAGTLLGSASQSYSVNRLDGHGSAT